MIDRHRPKLSHPKGSALSRRIRLRSRKQKTILAADELKDPDKRARDTAAAHAMPTASSYRCCVIRYR